MQTYKVLIRKLKETDHLGDLDEDATIILKLNVKEIVGKGVG
jgi:hypothetical protein